MTSSKTRETLSPIALGDTPITVILYAESIEKSSTFYSELLGRGPTESFPTFALYPLGGGMRLGLWATHDVEPRGTKSGASDEIAFSMPDKAAVDALYGRWQNLDVAIAQEPTAMDFGYTFVGLDPDGHRLRIYSPSAASQNQ